MSRAFSVCGALLAAAVTLAPFPVRAAATSRVVAFGDLNLDTDVGARVLLRRITFAARMVCRESPNDGADSLAVLIYRSCVHRTIGRSVAQFGSGRLSQVYERDSVVFPRATE